MLGHLLAYDKVFDGWLLQLIETTDLSQRAPQYSPIFLCASERFQWNGS